MGLKVCFISSYPPNRARLSEYAQILVAAIASRPEVDELHVIADQTLLPRPAYENGKVHIHRVWKADGLFSIFAIMYYVLRIRPNVVHFNISYQSFGKSKITNLCGLSLILWSRLLGFKVVAALHTLGDKADLTQYDMKATLINKIGILVATKIILSAQRVVVLVKTYSEYLTQRYTHNGVIYIPHGATVEATPALDGSENAILLFGHMGPHKGLPIMLHALKKIRQKDPSVKLIVAGTNHPNYPLYLYQFIRARLPNVEFTGYVPADRLASVFLRAKVVVLPYLAAPGTSGVFHLACGYARPVVASDLPELREMVNDGACAVLVPPGNVDSLVDAILKVMCNPKFALAMSQQNLHFAQRESWSVVSKAYVDVYLSLLRKKPR
ncbi:MAG: glycosyltransferase [Candidatus Bathyarchaeota archaeon]|nr:glycosyltransferase [Candidatus Bathyarchaeota archaeon]